VDVADEDDEHADESEADEHEGGEDSSVIVLCWPHASMRRSLLY